MDELCNKVKREFKSGERSEERLKQICDNNNIKIEDYLWYEGYSDYKEFEENEE